MSTPKSKQQLVELEYCFDKYFKQNFAPIIDKEYKDLTEKQKEEFGRMLDAHPVAPGVSGMMTASLTAQQVCVTGEWNTKHADYLLTQCNEKFFSDKSVAEDIELLTDAWRAAIVGEIGKEKYIELSSGVPGGDLGNYYVANRFQALFMEDLAKKKMPRDTMDYIFKKGIEESIPGFLGNVGVRSSDLDDKIKELSEKFYNPSSGEKIGSFGMSFLLDTASTCGYGSATKAATWLALDGGARLLAEALPSEYAFDELLGEVLWNDRRAFTNLRVAGMKVQPTQAEYAVSVNGVLNRQMFRPQLNDQKYKEIAQSLRDGFINSGTGYNRVAEGVSAGLLAAGFKISNAHPIPTWMEGKTDSECFTYATSWMAMALHLKSIGAKEYVLNGKKVTPEELAQKSYDYARALRASVRRQQSLPPEDVPIMEDGLSEQHTPFVHGMTVSTELPETPDYSSQLTDQVNAHFAIEEKFGNGGTPPAASDVPGASEEEPDAEEKKKKGEVAGWGGLLDNLGLGDFGTVGKNLGYVIAMLPDLLIGMFTGKSRHLKLDDNLLPLGSIVAGLFVKNPLLKMLLIGFGGANLLNKAGHEALDIRDGGRRQPVRQYLEYGDEVLDSRIKQPQVRGNTLLATIDNIPSVLTVNDEVIDAYEKGLIPLNTLCNAVLRKYDEQKAAVEESFIREDTQEAVVDRSHGLK